MNQPDLVLAQRESGLLTLTLNRPEAGNAIDVAMADALMHAAIEADEDASVRAVLLTGRGRFFCVGGDIGVFAAGGEHLGPLLKEIAGCLHSAISRFARMRKPLITAINGPAAGAGLSLAILGDIAIAARSAHFTLAYPAIGLSPDGGSTWLLPRLVGLRKAQELALCNRRTTAEEAAAMGLITRSVADDALAAEVTKTTTALIASATGALGRTRQLLLSSFGVTLESQMEEEARAIAESGRSADGREGIAAFLAKRTAHFTGE
ncbi:MAG TPA: enoyl-CoA hydratase-related protein [Steroidobacteraceae bacterium]